MIKRITLSMITCLFFVTLTITCIDAKDLTNTNGEFNVQISGPWGIETLHINAHIKKLSYKDLNKKSQKVSLSQRVLDQDLYGLRLKESEVYTKLDDKNNYTVMELHFTYTHPAHSIYKSSYYDKNLNVNARMNFYYYSQLNDNKTTSITKSHSAQNRSLEFTTQVNLGQIGIKTVNGQWKVNSLMGFVLGYDKYRVKYNVNGGDVIADTIVDCGQTIGLPAVSKNHYEFDGWLKDGQKVNEVYVCLQDVTLDAAYIPKKYSIEYEYDGGYASNVSEYTIETPTFTLNNPTKEKHEFVGWRGSCGDGPCKIVTIVQGSSGNLKFIAQYKRIYLPPTLNVCDRTFFINDIVSLSDLLKKVKATDDDQKDITSSVKLDKIDYGNRIDVKPTQLDTSKIGNYKVTYSVKDVRGLTSTKSAIVHIVSDEVSMDEVHYRFINSHYISTINSSSNWQNENQKQKLIQSMAKDNPIRKFKVK